MKIFLLFYMCHFATDLTHCYKTTVFYIYICSFSTKFTLHVFLSASLYFSRQNRHVQRVVDLPIDSHVIMDNEFPNASSDGCVCPADK